MHINHLRKGVVKKIRPPCPVLPCMACRLLQYSPQRLLAMMDDYMHLPPSVREIADVIGVDAAVRLVDALPPCGKRPRRRVLYVPKTLEPDHKLVGLLGWPDAMRMVRVFGGEILSPACHQMHAMQRAAERNAIIVDLAGQGWRYDEIGAELGITSRTVRNVMALQEQVPEAKQGELWQPAGGTQGKQHVSDL